MSAEMVLLRVVNNAIILSLNANPAFAKIPGDLTAQAASSAETER